MCYSGVIGGKSPQGSNAIYIRKCIPHIPTNKNSTKPITTTNSLKSTQQYRN